MLSNRRCVIGEGPIWNEHDGLIYQVNGWGNEILAMNASTGQLKVRPLDFGVAAIAFSKRGEMLVSCEDGAFILEPDGQKKPLYDRERYEIRFGNDAKVGPDGKFYVGSGSSKYAGQGDTLDGKLYSIDPEGRVTVLLDGMILSNGFDWSMDERRFYHTDSATRLIKEYDFDRESGSLHYTGRQVELAGVDGLTMGMDGCLYVACWGQSHIAVVDTADMQIKSYIETPTAAPASCCFVGESMDRLVVVTASYGLDINKDKMAGYTYLCDVGTRGRKPYLFG